VTFDQGAAIQVDGSQGEGGSPDGVMVTDDNAARRRLDVASRAGTVSVAPVLLEYQVRIKLLVSATVHLPA
jgi:hypothetical protein